MFWAPALLVLLLATSAVSVASSASSTRLPVKENRGGALQPPSARRRRRHRQHGMLLEPELGQGEWPVAETMGLATATEKAASIAPATGNSFISLRSPVIKVASPLPGIEDLASASGQLPSSSSPGAANETQEALRQDVAHAMGSAESSKPLQQQRAVEDGDGMRVVHLWKRTVGNFSAVLGPQSDKGIWCRDTILRHAFGCFMAVVASVLLIYVAVVVVKNWVHQVALRSVRVKIRRANEFFLGLHNDQPLCLRCVEFMPSSSPTTVTFLCGHSFHVCCTNECHKKRAHEDGSSSSPGCCPICPSLSSSSKPQSEAEVTAEASEAQAAGGTSADLARLFTLKSIREKYPGAFSQEDFERLATQPTAVLQCEMRFANQFQRDKSNVPLLRQCMRSKLRSIFG